MDSLKAWARHPWRVQGNFHLSLLRGSFMFFKFDNACEAKMVWLLGNSHFEGKALQLDLWRPDIGCFRVEDCVKEVWVSVRVTFAFVGRRVLQEAW